MRLKDDFKNIQKGFTVWIVDNEHVSGSVVFRFGVG
jgi:hypothetical protein